MLTRQIARLKGLFGRSDSSGQLARGSTSSFAFRILGTACLFMAQVARARLLGVDHFGTYQFVIVLLNLVLVGATLGYENVFLRFGPEYRVQNQWGLFVGLWHHCRLVMLSAAALTCALSVGLLWLLRDRLSPEMVSTAFWACLMLPVISIGLLQQKVLQALKFPGLAQIPTAIFQPVLLTIGLAILYFGFTQPVSAPAAMATTVVTGGLSLVVGIWCVYRRVPPETNTATPAYDRKIWFRTAFRLLLISQIVFLYYQVDALMLGVMVGTKEAGIYSAVSRIAILSVFGHSAIVTMIQPLVAELRAGNKFNEMQRIMKLASIGSTLTAVSVALVLIVGGKWILNLYGPGFAEGYWPLTVLLIGNLMNALTGPVEVVLIQGGHESDSLWIGAACLLMNVILNLVMIPRMGMTGAAVASAITLTFSNLTMVYMVWRRFGIISSVLVPNSYKPQPEAIASVEKPPTL